MTHDEIIEMAMLEAEFVSHGKPSEEESELFVCTDKDIVRFYKLVAAKAIAELESQEPVAKYSDIVSDGGFDPRNKFDTTPQRTWVGLTDEEISACDPSEECWGLLKIALAVEAKLKEKNT